MIVTVPTGMAPRLLSAAYIGPDLCQVQTSPDDRPCGRVTICCAPVGVAHRDAAGQFLHPVLDFSAPERAMHGKRRGHVTRWAPTAFALLPGEQSTAVECDEGCYWISTPCRVLFVGGVEGETYEVSIEYISLRELREQARDAEDFRAVDLAEDTKRFILSSVFATEGNNPVAFPGAAWPLYHTHFRAVAGEMLLTLPGAAPIAIDAGPGPGSEWIPRSFVNTPTNLAVRSGIYQTSVEL